MTVVVIVPVVAIDLQPVVEVPVVVVQSRPSHYGINQKAYK